MKIDAKAFLFQLFFVFRIYGMEESNHKCFTTGKIKKLFKINFLLKGEHYINFLGLYKKMCLLITSKRCLFVNKKNGKMIKNILLSEDNKCILGKTFSKKLHLLATIKWDNSVTIDNTF